MPLSSKPLTKGMAMLRVFRDSLLFLLSSTQLTYAQPGSIYWSTQWQPCGTGWGSPMVSSYVQSCVMGNTPVSICPGNPAYTFSSGPWEQGLPITIVNANITHVLDNSSSLGYFVIGSDHGGDGPDVFATSGAVGTDKLNKILANPFPQGADVPGSHIDIYAHCDTGNHMVIVDIDYVTR